MRESCSPGCFSEIPEKKDTGRNCVLFFEKIIRYLEKTEPWFYIIKVPDKNDLNIIFQDMAS